MTGTAGLAARVAVAVASALATAGLSAAGTGLWSPGRAVLAALVATVAVTAVAATATGAVRQWREEAVARREERLAYLLRSAAFAVADATGLDVRDLGVSVWLVGRGLPGRPRPLRRAHRERVGFVPGPSRVRWRVGVGITGRCVATGAETARDVGADWRRWRHVAEQEWNRVPDEVAMGLTREEWRSVAAKYGLVRAVPLVVPGDPPHVVGCLTLDGPDGSAEVLAGEPVGTVLRLLAESTTRVGLR